MRASTSADRNVPATGASWIMIGIEIAADAASKNSTIAGSGTRTVAPWYGGMIITSDAPAACARRLRSAHTRVPKCVVVTMTGTRPATWSSTATHDALALVVGQRELLGEVREDADAVRAGVDHEVDAAALAVEVELAAVVEDRRRHGKDTAVRARECRCCQGVPP